MPAPLASNDLYAADRPNQLSPKVSAFPYRIYVPNSDSNTLTEIDPKTYRVIRTTRVGRQPQHVVPSWDMQTLWVNNDLGNSLTKLDPATGKAISTVDVQDPYNLYFTPDGKSAVVMASARRKLYFRDPQTMELQDAVKVYCAGVNHADWSFNGRFFLVSCEFSGELIWVDTVKHEVVSHIKLPGMAKPQDVKISPDGKTFYVADMDSNGVWILKSNGDAPPTLVRLLKTGMGAHGLYVSRDSTTLYISNRDEGSISLLRFSDNALTTRWRIPGQASPDMGGVSPDGKVLWLSGRYDAEVYAIDTSDGHLIARIPVGQGPHGLCVFPQPGRYSLGHTGVFR